MQPYMQATEAKRLLENIYNAEKEFMNELCSINGRVYRAAAAQ